MKGINNLGKVLTKIVEVFHWVGVGLMAAAVFCALILPDKIWYFISIDSVDRAGAELSIYGFEVYASMVNGQLDMTTFALFGIGATLILALMAMIFRNLHLIFKNSEHATPFSKDNIRMMKEVGIFSIAIPIVGLIMSIIIRLVIGAEATEISLNQTGIIMGIIVLCLTQFFIHGAKLEQDVDGLV